MERFSESQTTTQYKLNGAHFLHPTTTPPNLSSTPVCISPAPKSLPTTTPLLLRYRPAPKCSPTIISHLNVILGKSHWRTWRRLGHGDIGENLRVVELVESYWWTEGWVWWRQWPNSWQRYNAAVMHSGTFAMRRCQASYQILSSIFLTTHPVVVVVRNGMITVRGHACECVLLVGARLLRCPSDDAPRRRYPQPLTETTIPKNRKRGYRISDNILSRTTIRHFNLHAFMT